MNNPILKGIILALSAVAIMAAAYRSLDEFSRPPVTVEAPAPKVIKPVVIKKAPPAPKPVTVAPLPKLATPEVPRPFYTVARAVQYTATGVKVIPQGTLINVLEAECGMVAITNGKITVVVPENRISNDVAVISAAVGGAAVRQ